MQTQPSDCTIPADADVPNVEEDVDHQADVDAANAELDAYLERQQEYFDSLSPDELAEFGSKENERTERLRLENLAANRGRWAEWRARRAIEQRRRGNATPVVRAHARAVATPRERREHRTSRTSGQSPPDDPELPEPDRFRLTLLWEKFARDRVSQALAKCCQCERDQPYTAPRWEIEPDSGHCRSCDLPLRDADVRRWHAIARDERARLGEKGWS